MRSDNEGICINFEAIARRLKSDWRATEVRLQSYRRAIAV
jgi:hypothetical protein